VAPLAEAIVLDIPVVGEARVVDRVDARGGQRVYRHAQYMRTNWSGSRT
jgi:hypothetical protein